MFLNSKVHISELHHFYIVPLQTVNLEKNYVTLFLWGPNKMFRAVHSVDWICWVKSRELVRYLMHYLTIRFLIVDNGSKNSSLLILLENLALIDTNIATLSFVTLCMSIFSGLIKFSKPRPSSFLQFLQFFTSVPWGILPSTNLVDCLQTTAICHSFFHSSLFSIFLHPGI